MGGKRKKKENTVTPSGVTLPVIVLYRIIPGGNSKTSKGVTISFKKKRYYGDPPHLVFPNFEIPLTNNANVKIANYPP